MKKGKQLLIIIFILAIFFGQVSSPNKVFAETTINSAKLNWSNPQKGSNPFKFTAQDFVNPQMMMSVVGCTGVVDKVTGAVTTLAKHVINDVILKKSKEKAIEKACQAGETAAGVALSTVINTTLSAPALKEMCRTVITQKSSDETLEAEMKKMNQTLKKQETFKECLSGIAVTLAKNQLVAMTKSTMNWITTGFNGDPMYIQNIDNFMSNLSNKITNKELDMFKDSSGNYNTTDYPYARSIAKSIVYSNDTQNDLAGAMKQDLTSYLAPGTTIKDFSNNFSQGGWSGWMALTQHPQNNPLGSLVQVSQQLAEKKEQKKQNTINETKQNGGYLSQKVCNWNALTKKGGEKSLAESQAALAKAKDAMDQAVKELTRAQNNLNEAKSKSNHRDKNSGVLDLSTYQSIVDSKKEAADNAKANYQQLLSEHNGQNKDPKDCPEWKVVTPGSTIKDKVSTYINSPERQLELAKTINDSLYTLFGALINKFRLNGLSSLGSSDSSFNKVSGGFGSNSLTTNGTVDNEGNPVPNSGGYASDDKFDLTRDLGNQYYHVPMTNLGNWNAETNTPHLSKGIGPYSTITKEYLSDVYYVVTKAGNTNIVPNAPNSWAVGDRAYFDGINWQDWKKDTPNPIKKRGVIQVQEDFIAASNLLLQHLPGVMPKIGELDYCIPGPNPSWQANSSNVTSAFMDFVNGLKTNYMNGSFLKRPYVTIDSPSGKIYNTYKNSFKGTGLWEKVAKTAPYTDISYLSSSAPTKRQTGKWKGNSKIGEANNRVQELQTKILTAYTTFTKDYSKIIDKVYGKDSLMQKAYLQKEFTSDFFDNSDYLPMASAGNEITANAISYNQQITNEAASYKEAISQAELNIYQLKIIARKVKKIVEDAQAQRAKTLASLKNKASNIKVKAGEDIKKGDKLYTTGSDNQGNPIVMKYTKTGSDWIGTANKNISSGDFGRMTKSSTTGWTIPVACLTEEQIDYIDNADMITDMGGTKDERCSDGIDNDLDGLIDAQDPDCKDQISDNGPDSMLHLGKCSVDMDTFDNSTDDVPSDEHVLPCNKRLTKNLCLNSTSILNNKEVECSWTEDTTGSGSFGGSGDFGSNGDFGGYKPPNDYLSEKL